MSRDVLRVATWKSRVLILRIAQARYCSRSEQYLRPQFLSSVFFEFFKRPLEKRFTKYAAREYATNAEYEKKQITICVADGEDLPSQADYFFFKAEAIACSASGAITS